MRYLYELSRAMDAKVGDTIVFMDRHHTGSMTTIGPHLIEKIETRGSGFSQTVQFYSGGVESSVIPRASPMMISASAASEYDATQGKSKDVENGEISLTVQVHLR